MDRDPRGERLLQERREPLDDGAGQAGGGEERDPPPLAELDEGRRRLQPLRDDHARDPERREGVEALSDHGGSEGGEIGKLALAQDLDAVRTDVREEAGDRQAGFLDARPLDRAGEPAVPRD